MTPAVTKNVNEVTMQLELTNAPPVHDFGTSMPGTGSLKFELPKPCAGGLNSTTLDTWLF